MRQERKLKMANNELVAPVTEKPNFRSYTTKSGKVLFKPSTEFAIELSHNNQGFCLACSATNDGVEPDARRYLCEACDNKTVYGYEELLIMDLLIINAGPAPSAGRSPVIAQSCSITYQPW